MSVLGFLVAECAGPIVQGFQTILSLSAPSGLQCIMGTEDRVPHGQERVPLDSDTVSGPWVGFGLSLPQGPDLILILKDLD